MKCKDEALTLTNHKMQNRPGTLTVVSCPNSYNKYHDQIKADNL